MINEYNNEFIFDFISLQQTFLNLIKLLRLYCIKHYIYEKRVQTVRYVKSH